MPLTRVGAEYLLLLSCKHGSCGGLSIGSSCGGGLLLCDQADITWASISRGKSLWDMRSTHRAVDREHLIVLRKGIRRHHVILSLRFDHDRGGLVALVTE
jgi:hypothetical protein